jgi:hypothetical protein
MTGDMSLHRVMASWPDLGLHCGARGNPSGSHGTAAARLDYLSRNWTSVCLKIGQTGLMRLMVFPSHSDGFGGKIDIGMVSAVIFQTILGINEHQRPKTRRRKARARG